MWIRITGATEKDYQAAQYYWATLNQRVNKCFYTQEQELFQIITQTFLSVSPYVGFNLEVP